MYRQAGAEVQASLQGAISFTSLIQRAQPQPILFVTCKFQDRHWRFNFLDLSPELHVRYPQQVAIASKPWGCVLALALHYRYILATLSIDKVHDVLPPHVAPRPASTPNCQCPNVNHPLLVTRSRPTEDAGGTDPIT